MKQRRSKVPQPEGASSGPKKGDITVAQATAGPKGKVRDDSPPATKRARRSSADGIRAGTSSNDEDNLSEEDVGKGQDEDDEQEDDNDDEEVEDVNASSEQSENEEDDLQEDPVEEKNDEDDGDHDEVLDGHGSD